MSFNIPEPPRSVQARNPELYDWMQKVKAKLEQSHPLSAGVALSQPATGDMVYKAPLAWARVSAGTPGQILTEGTSTVPTWGNLSGNVAAGTGITVTGSSTVTINANIAAGTGIAVSGTSTRSVALAPIADSRLLSNISGGTAAPSANSLSANLDYAIGTTTSLFAIRGTSGWTSRQFNSAIPCTGTSDDAAAGNLGEYASTVVTSGSAVTMGSNTTAPIASVVLSPGDWDVEGHIQTIVNGSTVLTVLAAGISGTSTTLGGGASFGGFVRWSGSVTGLDLAFPTGQRRFPLTGTSTVHLTALAAFATSTCSIFGSIRARRPR